MGCSNDERIVLRMRMETEVGLKSNVMASGGWVLSPMTLSPLSRSPNLLIPSHQREAVSVAVSEAFGPATVESFERIPKGASGASVFKVVVAGTACAMRIEGTPIRDLLGEFLKCRWPIRPVLC
jgi:hypothetical protein